MNNENISENTINEINDDFNKVKSLTEQTSNLIFDITSKYSMADENLYYVLINCRKACEHLFGSVVIAQNNGIEGTVYSRYTPYVNQAYDMQPLQNNNSKQFFPRQRASSSQSHMKDRWEEVIPTSLKDFSMSVPNSVIGCECALHQNNENSVEHAEPVENSDTKMDIEEISNMSCEKKAFADVVKNTSNKTGANASNEANKKVDNNIRSIKPFVKFGDNHVWTLQVKPGMALGYLHDYVNDLQIDIGNMSDLMNTKFYFRDPEAINMHGLWQYNKKYYLAENGNIYIYKKRELLPLKQNGKYITYIIA